MVRYHRVGDEPWLEVAEPKTYSSRSERQTPLAATGPGLGFLMYQLRTPGDAPVGTTEGGWNPSGDASTAAAPRMGALLTSPNTCRVLACATCSEHQSQGAETGHPQQGHYTLTPAPPNKWGLALLNRNCWCLAGACISHHRCDSSCQQMSPWEPPTKQGKDLGRGFC